MHVYKHNQKLTKNMPRRPPIWGVYTKEKYRYMEGVCLKGAHFWELQYVQSLSNTQKYSENLEFSLQL